LQADAHKKTLFVNPVLPHWLPEITLHNLRVGTASVVIRFWRQEDQSRYDVLSSTGEIHVQAGIAPPIDKLIETGGLAGRANAT
jgi:hypothetical protein